MKLEEMTQSRWNEAIGTPKTLLKAIRNGIDESYEQGKLGQGADIRYNDPEEIILKHVKDKLSQIFTQYMSGTGDLIDTTAHAIWEKIIS